MDDQSNGFQLEDSKLGSAAAIERLFFGIAAATLYRVAQGGEVVAQGQRREVDPHWFRGSRYLKIGWQWLNHALHKGWRLITRWCLSGSEDPDPAMASRRQYEQSRQKFQKFTCQTIRVLPTGLGNAPAGNQATGVGIQNDLQQNRRIVSRRTAGVISITRFEYR